MAQIEVRGLGANEIRIGRRRITPATEVVFALAFYLCVRAGERVTCGIQGWAVREGR